MKRRDFFRQISGGVVAACLLRISAIGASALFLAGCLMDAIIAYAQTAVNAVSSVANILSAAGIVSTSAGALIATVVAAIKASLAAISTAVSEYNNAPAADKATKKLQISLAIHAAIDNLQSFWNSLSIPDVKLNSLVSALISAIIAGLEGFLPQLPVPPQPAQSFPKMLTPAPKHYKNAGEFRTNFNKILADAGNGYSQYSI